MWDERKNLDWAPKIFKTQRIQTEKINTNPKISNTNPENQTQEHKKIKPKTHKHKHKNQTQLPPKFKQNTHKTINPAHLKLFPSENPLDRTLSPPLQPRFEQGENPNQ